MDLLKGNILTTIIKLSAPLMGTAFVQMTYSLTDVVWIGRVGTEAVAAAGTVGFLIWFSHALSLIPKIGMSVLTSQDYGAGDRSSAELDIRNGLQLAFVMGLLYGLVMIVYRDGVIGFFGLDTIVSKLAKDYLVIIALGFVFSFMNPVLSAAYNSVGNSVTPFRLNVIGLMINIVLDPVLIFGLGPIPNMGIRGAALATTFAQGVVSMLFIVLILKEKDIIYRSKPWKRPSTKLMKKIVLHGSPAAVNSGIHSTAGMILNKYMAYYGAVPVAVCAVGSMIESVSWMTTEGFEVGLTAFVGQNYGAGLYDRIKGAYRMSMTILIGLGLAVAAAFILFGEQLYGFFIPGDTEAIALGVKYLMIVSVSQVFMTVEIGAMGVFNGLGQTMTPGVLGSVLNILRIPMALALMPTFGVLGIWMSMSASSVFKGIISFLILKKRIYLLDDESK